MAVVINRFDVHLVNLEPTIGHEIRKVRPCVIVSPDEMNHNISTVIVAPLTTKSRSHVSRVPCRFKGRSGQIVLDQIRSIDQIRLIKRLGRLETKTGLQVLKVLQEMFAR